MKGHSMLQFVLFPPWALQAPFFCFYWVDNGHERVRGLLLIMRLASCHCRQITLKSLREPDLDLTGVWVPRRVDAARTRCCCCRTAEVCGEKLQRDWLRLLVNDTADWTIRQEQISWIVSRRDCNSAGFLTYCHTHTNTHLLESQNRLFYFSRSFKPKKNYFFFIFSTWSDFNVNVSCIFFYFNFFFYFYYFFYVFQLAQHNQ